MMEEAMMEGDDKEETRNWRNGMSGFHDQS